MSTSKFAPQFMKIGVLTAALQELTPREIRDSDPDRAIEDWIGFAHESDASHIALKNFSPVCAKHLHDQPTCGRSGG